MCIWIVLHYSIANCLSADATNYKIMESFIRDNDQMVVGFTATCAISVYHH
jgi:hypothetical protein